METNCGKKMRITVEVDGLGKVVIEREQVAIVTETGESVKAPPVIAMLCQFSALSFFQELQGPLAFWKMSLPSSDDEKGHAE